MFQNDNYLDSNDKDFKLIWSKEKKNEKSIYLYKAI